MFLRDVPRLPRVMWRLAGRRQYRVYVSRVRRAPRMSRRGRAMRGLIHTPRDAHAAIDGRVRPRGRRDHAAAHQRGPRSTGFRAAAAARPDRILPATPEPLPPSLRGGASAAVEQKAKTISDSVKGQPFGHSNSTGSSQTD